MDKQKNDEFEIISQYTIQQAVEDGVLVAVTKRDAVTRNVWEYLVTKQPKTSRPPDCWPVEMLGWFRAKNPDDKALALAKGLIGRDEQTARRVYENNTGGGIHTIFVSETADEIIGIVPKEIKGSTRTLWLIPNEIGGVTLLFPDDY